MGDINIGKPVKKALLRKQMYCLKDSICAGDFKGPMPQRCPFPIKECSYKTGAQICLVSPDNVPKECQTPAEQGRIIMVRK
jgi:hypothetical protein